MRNRFILWRPFPTDFNFSPLTTWRDVQHLIVNTAEYHPLIDNDGWQQNAAGYWFNIRFGFGLMNARKLFLNGSTSFIQIASNLSIIFTDSYVNLASNWTNVGLQLVTEVENPNHYIPLSKDSPVSNFTFDYTDGEIKYLEHVELILDLDCTDRGALEFYLTSPQKTRVQLLGQRPRDKSNKGFKDWSLMSVATWAENPKGKWLLEIVDVS